MKNEYIPQLSTIKEVIRHTDLEYTFRMEYTGEKEVKPGQFFEVSLPKYGEAPISVSGIGRGSVATAGLDPRGRDEILDKISHLHREKGMTIILVSHSMEDIARYADRLMVMNRGEKAFDGPPREVFEHYRDLETMGLAAPQVTYIVHGLREKGVPIDHDITMVEEARDAIVKLLKE